MANRKHTAEQVINKLKRGGGGDSRGRHGDEVARWMDVTQQTFYRWRTEYGGLRIDEARRLKRLERETVV